MSWVQLSYVSTTRVPTQNLLPIYDSLTNLIQVRFKVIDTDWCEQLEPFKRQEWSPIFVKRYRPGAVHCVNGSSTDTITPWIKNESMSCHSA